MKIIKELIKPISIFEFAQLVQKQSEKNKELKAE